MRIIIISILVSFFVSCSNDIDSFFKHKKLMEKLYGPCHWVYVGYDSEIINPAIVKDNLSCACSNVNGEGQSFFCKIDILLN